LLLAFVLLLGSPTTARGSLVKPTYAAGDKWVYILDGSITGFPGLNASQIRNLRFDLVGLVGVQVLGPANVVAGNASVPAVRVDTHATGYLNGSFSVPGGGTAQVTGSFTADTSEYWEDGAYLPIASNSTTSYRADVTYLVFTTPLAVDLRINAKTSISPIPRFDLDVGQSANATLDTHLELNSTFTILRQTTTMQNATNVSSGWRREVLSKEDVTVEAGTFAAYKLNQTLGGFPGLPSGVSGGNETGYFSNEVGFYVRRTAYENGTPAAEMRLKSYSYGAGPPSGLSATDLVIYVAIPIAAAILILLALRRRRKARIQGRVSEAAPPASGSPPQGGENGPR
jgi:hypothetical protein